ncbi:MAG: hypothetical protein Q9219_000185 [cf. Caloplaca sp. 3 TL-2023]
MDHLVISPQHSYPSLTPLTINPLIPASTLPPTPSSPLLAPTTPQSYISPTSLPPPPTPILSRSSSHASPHSTPMNNNGTPKTSHPASRHHSRRGTEAFGGAGGEGVGGVVAGENNYEADSSWLTRTASALAMNAMEEKGQSWLVGRRSATSLDSNAYARHDHDDMISSHHGREKEGVTTPTYIRSPPSSRYASRAHSRVQSRVGSRAGSRADLRMTKSVHPVPSVSHDEGKRLPKGVEDIEPDFVDLDERDRGEGVDADVNLDEKEMKWLVMGRVGGWVDWMVGWMDLRAEGGEEDERVEGDEHREERSPGEGNEHVKRREWKRDKGEITVGMNNRGIPAPGAGGGAWDDAKWLLRVAAESL